MRLIDADALEVVTAKVPKGMDAKSYMAGMEYVLSRIDALPIIEERKTGEWNRRKGMYEVGFKCSECNTFSISETPYCSFCGCRMVQEGEDNERA